MAGVFDVTIGALRAGQTRANGLAAEAQGMASSANAGCQQGSAATAGWGPLGESLTNAGSKLRGALGEGGGQGIAGMMTLTSTKLGACADGYQHAEGVNQGLQSGLGGLGGN